MVNFLWILYYQRYKFSDSLGRIFAYAISQDNRYAKGSNRKFMIDGIDNSTIEDTVPPVIKIYVDSRNFKNGDIVSRNPMLIVDLLDDSGINTTGLGIGHNLEAWIDDSPASISLVNNLKLNYSVKNQRLWNKFYTIYPMESTKLKFVLGMC